MTVHAKHSLPIIAALLAGFHLTAHAECSREDIDYYLQRGFTHDQVVRLCGAPARPAAEAAPTPAPRQSPPDAELATLSWLRAALDAEDVQLDPDTLTIIQDRCFPYGEENAIGFHEEICGRMTTTLRRKGLEIVRVKDPIPLLRDAELRVKTSVTRTFEYRKKIKDKAKQQFLADYPRHSETLDIPIKSGQKPSEAARKLKMIARQPSL
ncbi:MAG TPA: hypothetical protein ENK26_10770 [Gammaproteobacteria bacterium]|nr:hypothetical protein [Gammaproteobacteria bacterium]